MYIQGVDIGVLNEATADDTVGILGIGVVVATPRKH